MFGDDFLKGLQEAGESVASDVAQSAAEFIGASAKDALIRIGPEPMRNLTPEQIAAGQTGQAPGLRPSNQPGDWLFRAGSAAEQVAKSPALPLILGGLAVGYFIFRKRR